MRQLRALVQASSSPHARFRGSGQRPQRALALLACLVSAVCAADEPTGIFACEFARGAYVKDDMSESGRWDATSGDRAFGLSISEASLDRLTREACSDYLKKPLPTDEDAEAARLTNAQQAAQRCLARYEAIITDSDGTKWKYSSFNGVNFLGVLPLLDVFSVYGNGEFSRVFPSDDGPFMSVGRCARL